MDCSLPEGLTCNFTHLDGGGVVAIPDNTTWKQIGTLLEGKARNRVDAILGSYRPKIDELRSFLEHCDEACIRSYLESLIEKREKPQTARNGANETVVAKIEEALDRYFAKHQAQYEAIKQLYDKQKNGELNRREIYTTLFIPLLDEVQKSTKSQIGFVPIRNGFITLVRNGDLYYCAKGDRVARGKSLQEVLAYFSEDTTTFQIIDTNGRILGRVETPTSRALESMLFLENEKSKWISMAGNFRDNFELEYNTNGYHITLHGPRSGLGFTLGYSERAIAGLGNVRAQQMLLSYRLGEGEDFVALGAGYGRATPRETITGTQLTYSHHVSSPRLPIGNLQLHSLGNMNLTVQGDLPDVDTAKGTLEQDVLVSAKNGYVGVGFEGNWAPNIVTKDRAQIDWQKLALVGWKNDNTFIDVGIGKDTKRISLRHMTGAGSCRAMIEYQHRVSLLLDAQRKAEMSCVWVF